MQAHTMNTPHEITIFGEHDAQTIEQLERCVAAAEGARGVLCADGHLGYSQPIGGVVGYPEHVSPSGVGYDIGCGNKAVRLPLRAGELRPRLRKLMDDIVRTISFGVGRKASTPVHHPVLDEIAGTDFRPQRALAKLAREQLGTVGAGNHYVDVFSDEDDYVWIGAHFGSRGFGHRTASGFLALARGRRFDDKPPQGEMHAPPTLLRTDTDLGQTYIRAMQLAGRYAYAGRDVVVDQVCDLLGAAPDLEVHNHHNFAWRERHGGDDLWVIRKGATPAFPGELGFVGASMGEPAVILEGVDSGTARDGLRSTIHGAGRVLSRRQAKKTVDYAAVRAVLRAQGIELRGGDADEAPGAYKRLPEVLAAHAGTINVLHTLTPMGVAMAGRDVVDPFKD
jgi:tRNA-splicing ligase RtcB